jgi:hypothetical protein
MLEGQPNERLHWAVGLRATDRSLLVNTLQTEGEFQPRAYDVQGLLHYRLSPRHHLQLFGLSGKSAFLSKPQLRTLHYQIRIRPPEFIAFRTDFDGHENFTHRLSLLSSQLASKLSQRISLHQTFAVIRAFEHEDVAKSSMTRKEEALISNGTTFRDDQLHERAELYQNLLRWIVSSTAEVEAGLHYEQRRYDDTLQEMQRETPADSLATGSGFQYQNNGQAELFTRWLAAFGSYGMNFGKRLRLDAGLRWSFYEASAEQIVQPRLRLTITKDEQTTITAAWGRYAQPAGYHEMRADGYEPRKDIPAQRATHYVAGVQRRGNNGNEWQAQFYYKSIDRLIPYRVEDIFLRFQPDLQARGAVYGVSWYWRGQMTPRFTSWLTYSYMLGTQNIAGEGVSRLPTDQRHTFAAVLQDHMPDLPRARAHLRVLFGSGYPYTPVYSVIDSTGTRRVLVEAKRNSMRLTYYRRIDVGLSYNFSLSPRVNARLSLEVFNIFDFRNLLSYTAFIDTGGELFYTRLNLSRRLFNGRVSVQL